jgi:hypothetical protein
MPGPETHGDTLLLPAKRLIIPGPGLLLFLNVLAPRQDKKLPGGLFDAICLETDQAEQLPGGPGKVTGSADATGKQIGLCTSRLPGTAQVGCGWAWWTGTWWARLGGLL